MKVPFWKLDIANDEVKIVLDALVCHRDALVDSGEPGVDVDVDLLEGVIERIQLRIVPLSVVKQSGSRAGR